MFGLSPKPPVSDEISHWVDDGFKRLAKMLGHERMLNAQVVLPNDHFFPDAYNGSKAAAIAMAERIATYMGVAHGSFSVELYAENETAWRESVPLWHGETSDAAGLYFHKPEEGRLLVGIHADQLADPLSLGATLAHELAHVVLLGGGLLDADTPDMEPMTDLCTVFLGMGVISATAAYQFKQWTNTGTQGWSTRRTGYLPEPLWGYALARFAAERGERKPEWAKGLSRNIRPYFDQSARWIERNSR